MKLKPLGDRVILQYKKVEKENSAGIILPDSAKEKSQEAVVIAVGDRGCEEASQVKAGDKVIVSKYAGTEVEIEEEEYVIISTKDIIATVEE